MNFTNQKRRYFFNKFQCFHFYLVSFDGRKRTNNSFSVFGRRLFFETRVDPVNKSRFCRKTSDANGDFIGGRASGTGTKCSTSASQRNSSTNTSGQRIQFDFNESFAAFVDERNCFGNRCDGTRARFISSASFAKIPTATTSAAGHKKGAGSVDR